MKIALRTCIILMVLSYLTLEILTDYFLQHQLAGGVFVVICAFTGLFTFFYLVYWWFKSKFINNLIKFLWLVVLLFGYFMIGPICFYIFVYEFKKTVI